MTGQGIATRGGGKISLHCPEGGNLFYVQER